VQEDPSRFVALSTFVVLVALGRAASAQHGLPPVPPPVAPAQTQHVEQPAAEPSEADLERARVLFTQGLDFVAQHDWRAAAERFEQVLAIRSSPVVSYNLASALAEQGERVESSKLLTQLLGDVQADAETRRAALLLLNKIEPQIGTLSISVYGNSKDCSFTLDGEPLEIAGAALSLRVDVGDHTVTVERDGLTILSPQVTIGGTSPMLAQLALEIPPRPRPMQVTLPPPRKAVDLQLSRPKNPPRREEPRDDESVLEPWWLWAGAGAIVAGAVVATLVLTSSDEAKPIAGDTDPAWIRTRVVMGTIP
jgi:hypothetical protein